LIQFVGVVKVNKLIKNQPFLEFIHSSIIYKKSYQPQSIAETFAETFAAKTSGLQDIRV
jgi:hypothetical protein